MPPRRSFARENLSSMANVNTSRVFATGTFKIVYQGTYTQGQRRGQPCVCKIFKSGSVFDVGYFASEMKIVAKAVDIVDRFNEKQFIDREIWVNRPTVWTFTEECNRGGEKALIEPMIENFEKFNSNTGWTPDYATAWTDAMQALSHYSYHTNDRRAMLCDLQGAVYRNGFIITDPVIMSTTQEFGPTDLGPRGISTFFARHQCNSFCQDNWILPNDRRPYFEMRQGSSMMMQHHLPTRQSRAPLTRFNQIAEEEEEEDDDYY